MAKYIKTYSNPEMLSNDNGIRKLENSINNKTRANQRGGSTGREWENHKWVARKRNTEGKWIYDYGDGFPDEQHDAELKKQYVNNKTDKYANNTVGRFLKTVSDVTSPVQKEEIYTDTTVGKIARLYDDVGNVARAFINDAKHIKLPW